MILVLFDAARNHCGENEDQSDAASLCCKVALAMDLFLCYGYFRCLILSGIYLNESVSNLISMVGEMRS